MFDNDIYSYYRDSLGSGDGYGLYGKLAAKTLYAEQGIYRILSHVALYSAALAFLAAVVYLIVCASSPKELTEAKAWIFRILVLSILMFAVTSLITLIGTAGMDI